MINLKNDYCGIAHPKVLNKFIELQNETFEVYGLDNVSDKAKELIKKDLKCDNCDIHFVVGGTITNKTVIAHTLKPYEAVISADTGHINVHETGAIEETGHKVITVKNVDGKVTPLAVEKACLEHTDEHMVKPKMLYISDTTEMGTVYTLDELKALKEVCEKYNLYFYLDGARLSSALSASDVLISDLPSLVDVFYIGGAKNGLMLGEAIVIMNDKIKEDFRFAIKHFGAMYSKGFVAGINFLAAFEDGLYYQIGKEENLLAKDLYNKLLNIGIEFETPQVSNQIFPIFKTEQIEKLSQEIMFEIWKSASDKTTIRFVTSYMTKQSDIDAAVEVIKKIVG